MRTLYTLLIICISFSLHAQLQLDSIVYRDFDTNEREFIQKFAYENDKLSQYTETDIIEDLDDVDLAISYNANGDFEQWENLADDEFFLYEFIYDSNNEMDSLVINFIDYGYETRLIFDITNENGLIKNHILTTVYDTYSVEELRRDYFYDSEGKLERYENYEIYGSDVFLGSRKHEYTEEGLIRIIQYKDSDNKVFHVDSFNYDSNGDIASYYGLDTDDSPPTANDQVIYDIDPAVNFNSILTPVDLYDILFYLSDGDYHELYVPMKSKKVNSFSNISIFGNTNATWYYSLFTGLINKPVVATPIAVFPNPTSDIIQFKTDENISQFTIYTMDGKIVMSGDFHENSINVSGLPTGSYTAVASNKEGENFFAGFVKK